MESRASVLLEQHTRASGSSGELPEIRTRFSRSPPCRPGLPSATPASPCAGESANFFGEKLNPNLAEGAVSWCDRPQDDPRLGRPGRTMRMIMLGGGSTDRELLDHYVHEQDAAAFRDLVSRHGSVVHRVCRDVLKDIARGRGRLPGDLPGAGPQGAGDPRSGGARGLAAGRGLSGRDPRTSPGGPAAGDREGAGRDVAR